MYIQHPATCLIDRLGYFFGGGVVRAEGPISISLQRQDATMEHRLRVCSCRGGVRMAGHYQYKCKGDRSRPHKAAADSTAEMNSLCFSLFQHHADGADCPPAFVFAFFCWGAYYMRYIIPALSFVCAAKDGVVHAFLTC